MNFALLKLRLSRRRRLQRRVPASGGLRLGLGGLLGAAAAGLHALLELALALGEHGLAKVGLVLALLVLESAHVLVM